MQLELRRVPPRARRARRAHAEFAVDVPGPHSYSRSVLYTRAWKLMLRPLVLYVLSSWHAFVAPATTPPRHPGAGPQTGWVDCSGTAPDARSVQRAWRRMALTSHPDKTDGGSSQSFEDMTKLRDSLKDPDKYQIHRLLNSPPGLRAFGSRAPELRVTSADLTLRRQCTDVLDQATCFPYAVLRSDFSLSKELPPGSTWTFALGAKNVSTIQYHGDEEAGGYDACCDLRKDSVCVRRRVEPVPSLANGRSPGSDQKQTGDGTSRSGGAGSETRECADSPITPPKGVAYDSHDCPMGDVFTTEVSRPLHVMAPGLWAATLSLRSSEGTELACVAAAMTVLEEDVQRPDGGTAGNDSSNADHPEQKPEQQRSDAGYTYQSGSNKRESAQHEGKGFDGREPAAVSFAFYDRGVYCEDGIDILEGALDDYSVNPTETLGIERWKLGVVCGCPHFGDQPVALIHVACAFRIVRILDTVS